MRGLLLIGAGVAGVLAYRKGYLGELAGLIRGEDDAPGMFDPRTWAAADDARQARNRRVREAMGGEIVPILGDDEVVTVNKYEATLREHWSLVSPWAQQNVGWAAAIMAVENAGINPALSGDGGTSHGIYQVKEATADTVARAGYSRVEPTRANLLTVAGGVYFGTAEMDRLSRIPGKGDEREWVIAAYNGGAGWESMPAKYRADRQAYVQRVKRKFVELYGQGVA